METAWQRLYCCVEIIFLSTGIKLDLTIDSEQKFFRKTNFFLRSLTFLFLRGKEWKWVTLLWNNFSSIWFNFKFCSETVELCWQLLALSSKRICPPCNVTKSYNRLRYNSSKFFTSFCGIKIWNNTQQCALRNGLMATILMYLTTATLKHWHLS